MYIELTNEKGHAITVMASAIIYFEDTTHTNPDVKTKIIVHGHTFNVTQSVTDIRGLLDGLSDA
jgi:hypothetical protein